MSQPPYPPPADDGAGEGSSWWRSPLGAAGIVILAALGLALFLVLGSKGDDPAAVHPDRRTAATEATGSTGAGALPDPIGPPDGLGDDPLLDSLATACYTGDMRSCDDLYDRSDAGSDYETYGDSCAGRQASGTLRYCTETFPKS
jgi:hypothetical protein